MAMGYVLLKSEYIVVRLRMPPNWTSHFHYSATVPTPEQTYNVSKDACRVYPVSSYNLNAERVLLTSD